ncbi:MAG TPA: hypothetical protein VHE35_06345 [Kofleriaceae bacterium]|nr:hypothetical protein [Kofleriaceae bacterium]
MFRACALVLCLLAACASDRAPDGGLVAALDERAFQCGVEPILARDCSYTGCHGRATMPLRVYSVGKLRLGPAGTTDERTAPITDAERHRNYLSAVAFTYGGVAPEDNLLLRMALPSEDGGYAHVGGAIFTGPDDPRAVAIETWLSGGNPCALPP